jgi:hypothetical protein
VVVDAEVKEEADAVSLLSAGGHVAATTTRRPRRVSARI